MKAGSTFYISDRDVDSHLWVVISDPERDPLRVIMISMTTYENYKEDACLLGVGDHPAISRTTCIAYNETRLTTLDRLNALASGGHLTMQPAVSGDVLQRVRDGVSKSRRIHYKYVEILLEQRVIK
jgi:hypothetical protein